jgi:tetratricopeptide (TPR) repeat protein
VVAVAPPSSDDASPDRCRRICETIGAIFVDHGGAVDTPGEGGVIAVFGSGEDTDGQVDCAIQSATAIVEAMSGLESESDVAMPVAIGIDGGTVAEAEAATAVEAMIALARTLAAAGTGSDILASKAVVDASAGRVNWLAMGELKSVPAGAAVRAWRLRSRDPVATAPENPPVAGREPVLSHFARMIESCLASGKGQGAMILGSAGSGKSRLIEEFASMAARSGFSRIALHNCGFCELQAGDAVASLAAALMGIGPDASPDERRSAIDRFIDSRVVERKWRAALNDLFFLPHDPETGLFWELLDVAGREEGLQTVLRRLMRDARPAGPKLLTIEDIHNASARTVAQLAGLVRDLDDQPVVFAATARKEPAPLRPDWIAALQHNNARTIQLEPLTPDEAAALASGFGDPSDSEILKCIGRARGNPLFLEQLLVSLRAGRTSDGLTTVESLVLARCDGLSPIDRRALRAAAVLGRCGPLPALRAMIDDSRYGGVVLVAERILAIEGDRYRFMVAAVRDAVYASLDRTERQDLHASAARCFAGKDHALYARHLERAADSLAPRAYAQAAETSIGERRHGRALALIRQGLQIVSLGEDRGHLTCLEADCLLASGSVSLAVESYRKALEHAQHDAQRCRAHIGIGRGLGLRGQFGEALEELDTAQALAEKRSLTRELARIHCLKGRFFAPLGRIHKAGEHFGLALDLARRGAMPEEVSRACRGLGHVAETGGRFAVARTHFADSVDTARTHGLGRLALEDDLALARTRYYLDPMTDVLEHSLSIVGVAAEMGHHAVELEAHLLASAVLYDLGRFESVLEHFDRAQDVGARVRTIRTEAAIASFAARALSALDRRDEARMLLGEALKAARETEPAIQGGFVLGAVVLLARGQKTRESALAEADELLARGASSHGELRFYRDAIDAALGAGDPRQAMRYVGLFDAYSRSDSQPWSDFIIARGRALAAIAAGRGDAATGRELRQLMADARLLGYVWAQPAMRAALDDLRRGPVEFAQRSGRRMDVPIDIVPDAGQSGRPERKRS